MKPFVWILAAVALYGQVLSEWAFEGPDHRLHYRTDAHGNSIMDFSSAGYRGGGVKLPSVAAAQRLTPVHGDNTARIQAALDSATGAVSLAAGEYEIAGCLRITRSGVVLRGEKGAVIRLTGQPHGFLEIQGTGTWREEGAREPVLDAYAPAGASVLRVQNAPSFHAGDRVLVLAPATPEWLHMLGTDKPARHAPPSSIPANATMRTDRVVEYADSESVTLDAPLSDVLDARVAAASLVRYSFPGRISESGVEGLRITASFAGVPAAAGPVPVLRMDAVEDGWARDLEIQDSQNGIAIGPSAKRLTLTNVRITHTATAEGSAAAVDFSLQGTQVLLDRCSVKGEGTWPVVTETEAIGPLVVLNFAADHGGIASHQPWTTGLLVDGGKFPGGTERKPGVAFPNPATAGKSPEWGAGWSVAWNVNSPCLLVQQPPGAINWCIGCTGTPVSTGGTPNGIFDSPGKAVEPASLYLHQLRDRLGPDAVRNIGY